MGDYDYSVCESSPDGKHQPQDGHDPEIPAGFAAIECAACGLSTGIPIPPVEEITWG